MVEPLEKLSENWALHGKFLFYYLFKKTGISDQFSLGQSVGVSKSIFNRWLTGKHNVTPTNLDVIAEFIFGEIGPLVERNRQIGEFQTAFRHLERSYQIGQIHNDPLPYMAKDFLQRLGLPTKSGEQLPDKSPRAQDQNTNLSDAAEKNIPRKAGIVDTADKQIAGVGHGSQLSTETDPSRTDSGQNTNQPASISVGSQENSYSKPSDEATLRKVVPDSLPYGSDWLRQSKLLKKIYCKLKLINALKLRKNSRALLFFSLFAAVSSTIVSLYNPNLIPQNLRYEAATRFTDFDFSNGWHEDTAYPDRRESVFGRFTYDLGLSLLEDLHDERHLPSTNLLADILSAGYYVDKDLKRSFELNKQAYEAGSLDGALSYAWQLANGLGVPADPQKAQKIFSELDEASAMLDPFLRSVVWNNIGWAYWIGDTRTRDPGVALSYLEKAARLDNALAMSNLGLVHKNGAGDSIPINLNKAEEYFRKAYELGEEYGLINLIYLLRDQEEYEQAFALSEEAAQAGSALGLTMLGEAYADAIGVDKDYSLAASFFRDAVERGSERAAVELAKLIYDGEIQEVRANERQSLYVLVENGRDAYALQGLANHYKADQAVLPRSQRAAEIYKKSMELGNAAATSSYARMVQQGRVRGSDVAEAIPLYRLAASRGSEWATIRLAKIMMDESSKPVDTYWGENALLSLQHSTDPWVLSEIGYFYENHRNFAESTDLAFEFYERASKEGSHWATCRVARMVLEDEIDSLGPKEAVKILSEYAGDRSAVCKDLVLEYFSELVELGFDLETLKTLTLANLPDGNQLDLLLLARMSETNAWDETIIFFELIERSANGGNPEAMVLMAREKKLEEIAPLEFVELTVNGVTDVEWLERAAATGSSAAILELTELTKSGQYKSEPLKKWFAKLVEFTKYSENHRYEYLIASVYLSGLGGVERNVTLALPWLEKAARRVPSASIHLARIYAEGVLVDRDLEQVLTYVESLIRVRSRDAVVLALNKLFSEPTAQDWFQQQPSYLVDEFEELFSTVQTNRCGKKCSDVGSSHLPLLKNQPDALFPELYSGWTRGLNPNTKFN